MKIDGSQPIVKIAAELPGAIAVFESLGLDYACAGDRSLDDAAHAEGIEPEVLLSSLRRLKIVEHAESWDDRSLAELTNHLVTQHHGFVRGEMSTLAFRLADLCSAPGEHPSDLLSLRAAFTRLSEIVLPHLHREEENVFPTVIALESAWQKANERSGADTLSSHLRELAAEHGAIAAQLRTMRELRLRIEELNELPPQCRPVLEKLATLEAHLHEYMFLENCVLFPRAAALADQASMVSTAVLTSSRA